jgi:hypothetical protein
VHQAAIQLDQAAELRLLLHVQLQLAEQKSLLAILAVQHHPATADSVAENTAVCLPRFSRARRRAVMKEPAMLVQRQLLLVAARAAEQLYRHQWLRQWPLQLQWLIHTLT